MEKYKIGDAIEIKGSPTGEWYQYGIIVEVDNKYKTVGVDHYPEDSNKNKQIEHYGFRQIGRKI